jgi:elastase-2/chymotrypsin-like protease
MTLCFFRVETGGPMYLKGVVSFGTQKCGTGFPGVYTNLAFYVDWIRSKLRP